MQSNILFIDDESAVRDALKWTFADEPYGCLTCKSPEEALKLMEKMDFAVVISDQRMPEMNGTEFLERIKDQWPETIRILMTAYQETGIIMDAVNKGHIYNLIFKPWDEVELKRTIKTAVEYYTLKHSTLLSDQNLGAASHSKGLTQNLKRKNQYLMERLKQAQKMESLGRLASGISHDFNNILLVINSNLKFAMLDNSLSSDARSHLFQVLKASNRAKDLVSQIRTFSTTNESDNSPIMFGPLVKEVVDFLRAAHPARIDFHHDIAVGYEKIQLEATKVYQILMNLCSNAIDSIMGGQGVVYISLTLTRIEKTAQVEHMKLLPGDYFRLLVRDNGCGIEETNLKKIFDPYFTTKRENGGTGIGLALINQIVQENGGRILVQSEIGKGSDFTIYFPLYEE